MQQGGDKMKVKYEFKKEGKMGRYNNLNGIGNLIREYENFYLIDTGKYRICINKACIRCGSAKLKMEV